MTIYNTKHTNIPKYFRSVRKVRTIQKSHVYFVIYQSSIIYVLYILCILLILCILYHVAQHADLLLQGLRKFTATYGFRAAWSLVWTSLKKKTLGSRSSSATNTFLGSKLKVCWRIYNEHPMHRFTSPPNFCLCRKECPKYIWYRYINVKIYKCINI